MSAVQIQGNASGTGTLTIAAPNTNTNQTLTLPDLTGTLSVNGPAFSAYANAVQTFTTATSTKVLFQTEEFDTNNNFSSSRFTPTIAGYYQVNACIYFSAMSTLYGFIIIQKNGVDYKYGSTLVGTAAGCFAIVSTLVYMNGTTDYLETFASQSTGVNQNSNNGIALTWFNGAMVRGA